MSHIPSVEGIVNTQSVAFLFSPNLSTRGKDTRLSPCIHVCVPGKAGSGT